MIGLVGLAALIALILASDDNGHGNNNPVSPP
jgi:hypothetical protein